MKTPAITSFLASTVMLFSATPLLAQKESAPGSWRGQSITEFEEKESDKFGWEITNDGVMGGLSKGNVQVDDGILVFSGNLSLKNNGGFTTFRSKNVNLDLSSDLGILLRVKGDGRTYDVRLATDATYRSMEASFSASFETAAGEWQEIKVPFSEFTGSFRGRELKDLKFDPSKIKRVGILLGDKKEAPFRLEIDWIRTYGKGQGSLTKKKSNSPKTLVDTVLADGRFQTLATALTKADLIGALQGKDPLTVFAPTDEAFSKIPEKDLKALLQPENKEKLIDILTYHVVPGSNKLGDALQAGTVATLQGDPLKIAFKKGKVMVNEASLIDADVTAPNGVIHVIDSVLLPQPKRQTLLTTAEKAGGFTTVLAALEAAGLSSALEGDKPLTVFAPTDEAFAALPKGTVENLLKKENRKKLVDLLTSHVVPGNVSAGDALNAGSAEALSGKKLGFAIEKGLFTVNGSVIRTTGIDAGNGTIHVISSVIGFPKSDGFKSDSDCESDCEKDGDSKFSSSVEDMNAADLITAAIDRGVPLYNSGKIEECADIYENCLMALSKNSKLDAKTRAILQKVAQTGKHMDENRRAWLYRHTLDRMMHSLSSTDA